MCGIAGYFQRTGSERAVEQVARMLRAQAHRGPDGAGIWANTADRPWSEFAATPWELRLRRDIWSNCVLGHNWLAIQDTALSASQPMRRGPLTVVFNGEIYNFVELREELAAKGECFDTQGDTEVLLAMWLQFGEACLSRLRGMFAFLLHDARSNSLWAVRDALGIKPLYLAETGAGVFFGSEIRAFHAAQLLPRRIRHGAALAAIGGAAHRFGEFDTLYEGIEELPAGFLARIGPEGVQKRRWFALPPLQGDLAGEEHCEMLLAAIRESVAVHLRSSRQIAACLSGGLDSSTLVSLMGQQNADCTAFTINTAVDADSEIELAKEVIAGAGLQHRVFNHQSGITASDVFEMAVACEVPNHVIGPINQYLLMREIASQGFSVAVEGTGGDELVSGYSWWFPALLAEMRTRGQQGISREIENSRARHLAFDAVTTNNFDDMFYNPRSWIRGFTGDGVFGITPGEIAALPEFQFFIAHDGSWKGFRERAYATDTMYYLLRQADRIGMSFGLECRVPFADAELIRTAARLAPELLIREGYLKYPFRRMNSGIPDSVRWCTRKLGYWRTDNSRFPWMRELGRAVVMQSDIVRRLLPKIEQDWATARMDQQWRVLQIAILEQCTVKSDVETLVTEAASVSQHH